MEYLADNLHEYVQRHKRDFKELVHFAYDIAKGLFSLSPLIRRNELLTS